MRLKICVIILSLLFSTTAWGGVHLNGDSDRIQIGNFLTENQSAFSVALWIRTDLDTRDDWMIGAGAFSSGFVFFRDDVGGGTGRTDVFRILVYSVTSNYDIIGATGSAPKEQWIHVCFTFSSGNDRLRLYVNGVEDANSPDTGGSGDMKAATTDIRLGAEPKTSPSAFFDGKITEVEACFAELTADEVAILASSMIKRMPLQIQPSSLQMYLPLDDFTSGTGINGKTFFDLSGNGNSGTGVDGDNDSICIAEEILSYPAQPLVWQ